MNLIVSKLFSAKNVVHVQAVIAKYTDVSEKPCHSLTRSVD